jgi:hypothetical protein
MLVCISQNRGSVVDMPRVPIYSLSSWSSIVSLKAAMFVDPIRDVYEVMIDLPQPGKLLSCLGLHNLHVLPASHQLPGRGARPHNYDAWSRASSPFVASEPRIPYGRHLRSTYILGDKAWDIAICLVEANTGSRVDRHESDWDL